MKRIMIVDDAEFMRTSIKIMLESEKYDVLEAEDGNEAVKKYKEARPDVVTMDITMPGKTGLEAIKEIREFDPEAKIIVVTAMGTEFMIRDAIQLGAANFIIKPFDEEQLLEVIKKLL